MRWGIDFTIPAAYESDLWILPRPSNIRYLNSSNGGVTLNVVYHFQYPPQSWKEWQRVAGIKIQISKRIRVLVFNEYELYGYINKVYTISELGQYFRAFIKFPQALFPSEDKEIYQRLCIYAKRLHYEQLLYAEQLIAVSIRFHIAVGDNSIKQIIMKALSAYRFAIEHQNEWKVKLTEDERHKTLSRSAYKSANTRRNNANKKKMRAIALKNDGKSLEEIMEIIGVSRTTLWRLLK